MTTVYPNGPVQMERRCPIIGCLCFLLFAILGIVSILTGFVLYDQFDQLFGDTVRQQMEINDDTFWWYQRWLQPPVHQTLTVHVFKVENWAELRENWLLTINETYIQSMLKRQQDALNKQRQQEILRRLPAGSRRQVQIMPVSTTIKPMVERSVPPRVREIGPFVFRIEQWKEQVNFTDQTKQQLSYEQRTRYHFEPLLSYDDLQLKVMVANAELSALNPFIRLMLKRAQSVARISQALRANIEQILQLYALNMFVERTVGQVIFGSTFQEDEKEEQEETPSFLRNETNGNENGPLILNGHSRLVNGLTKDMTINRILVLYDRIEPYLKRLGVNLDPYQLLSGAYKYEADARRGSRLVDVRYKDGDGGRAKSRLSGDYISDPVDYRDNFVWSFFTNDSREKYDIFTGVETNRNGEIIRWNQQTFMDDWFGRWCNTINGTDGRQYPPFLRTPRIYGFVPRICRSVPMKLTDLNVQATPSGVRIRRYTKADDFMQSPYKNKNNGCFCRFGKQPKRCNYDGILDLANCYHGAPIILTNPHFSGKITRSIEQSIDGLTPDDGIHQTQIDVEPVSGIVLDRSERFQFNVHLQPITLKINSTRYLPELIVPLLWYQERSQASKEYQQSIKYLFVYPMRYQEYGVIALILLGMFLAFIGIISAFVCCCTHKPVKMRSRNVSLKAATPPPITVQTSTPPDLNSNSPTSVRKPSQAWAEPEPILVAADAGAEQPKPSKNQQDEPFDEESPQLFANVDVDQNPDQTRPKQGNRIMKYGLTQAIYQKHPVIPLSTATISTISQQIPVVPVLPVVEIDEIHSNTGHGEPEEGSGDLPIQAPILALTTPLSKPSKLKPLAMIKSNWLGKLKTEKSTPTDGKTTWPNQKPNQQLSISELFPSSNIDENILEHVLDDDDVAAAAAAAGEDDNGPQFPEDNIYEKTSDSLDHFDIYPLEDSDFAPRDYVDEEDDDGEHEEKEEKYDDDDNRKVDPTKNPVEQTSASKIQEEPVPLSAVPVNERWRLAAKRVWEARQKERVYILQPGWPTRRDLMDDHHHHHHHQPHYLSRMKKFFHL